MKTLIALGIIISLAGCGGGGGGSSAIIPPNNPPNALPQSPYVGHVTGEWIGLTTRAMIDVTVHNDGSLDATVTQTDGPVWVGTGTIDRLGYIVIGNFERQLAGTVVWWADNNIQPPRLHLQGQMDFTRPVAEGPADTGVVDLSY